MRLNNTPARKLLAADEDDEENLAAPHPSTQNSVLDETTRQSRHLIEARNKVNKGHNLVNSTCNHRCKTTLSILSFFAILYLAQLIQNARADIVIISPANRTTEIFDNAELSFGFITFLEDTPGKVVLAEPEDACSEIKSSPNPQETWFVLARRYPCTFETKVRNAAKAGFKAIIIYSVDPDKAFNTTPKLPLQFTQQIQAQIPQQSQNAILTDNQAQAKSATGSIIQYNLYIPAVLISNIDGEDIKENYLADKGYTALILPRIPLNAYLLPFAIAIILCLFLMVSFLVFQIIKCARDRRKLQRHRLTNRQLKQLLTTIYTKGSQYDTCAICLEEYVDGEKLRVLPCRHGYHLRCIDPWLTKSRRICPVCKGKVRVSGMSDISDTESESEQTRHGSYHSNAATESTPLLREQQRPTTRSQRRQATPTDHYQAQHPTPSNPPTTVTSTRTVSVNGSINGVYSDNSSLSSAITTTSTTTSHSRRVYVDANTQ